MNEITRVAINQGVTLSHTFYNGTTAVLATGAVTVNIIARDGYTYVDENGVVQSVAATTLQTGSATGPTGNAYTFVVAPQTQVNWAVVEWRATVSGVAIVEYDQLEFVGNFYFSLSELKSLQGMSGFTDVQLANIRDVTEEFIESFTNVAWCKRWYHEVMNGNNRMRVYVQQFPARQLIRVINTDLSPVVRDTTKWSFSYEGALDTNGFDSFSSGSSGGQNIEVWYAYGWDYPQPDLQKAALRLARHFALTDKSQIPDRARLMTTEFATFHLSTADAENAPTGVPEIDSILIKYRRQILTVSGGPSGTSRAPYMGA